MTGTLMAFTAILLTVWQCCSAQKRFDMLQCTKI
jgi:hypothetical protein